MKASGTTYTYEASGTEIIEPEETSVLQQPASGRFLTLITCHPVHAGSHRLIVHAAAAEHTPVSYL
ncbi:sortase domain-containing protein [Paenibacillus gansuensis]|uniref:Sortase domain-bontaining protein n=1 Tax=Paenibacillus gansuensis TaxID=306542 RepID=A0ABW5P9G8_9BACL